MIEQAPNVDKLTQQIDQSSNSPPQTRAKRQPDDNLQHLEATSINAARTDDNLPKKERN